MNGRKWLIKAAREVSLERIREVLRPGDDIIDDYFLVYNHDLDYWFICCWSRTNGMMMMTIDDAPLSYATMEYMKNHGYLQFESEAEALAHVRAQGWTCSRTWPGQAS